MEGAREPERERENFFFSFFFISCFFLCLLGMPCISHLQKRSPTSSGLLFLFNFFVAEV